MAKTDMPIGYGELPGSNVLKPLANPAKPVDAQKISPVVKTSAKEKEKTFGDKLKEAFIGESVSSVGDYLIFNILVPTIKNTLFSAINTASEMFILGTSGSSRDVRRPGQYVSYGNFYRGNSSSSNASRVPSSNIVSPRNNSSGADVRDLIFETKADAQSVLYNMCDVIDCYNAVTVARYYELSGVTSNYQDHNWGWTNLSRADVVLARGGGFYIDLPPATYLN